MPDNKPMTPEEFAKRLAADKYISLTYEQRIAMKLSEWAESIRREAKRPLIDALISIEEYWNGSVNKSAMSDAIHEMRERATEALREFREVPIDTPPAADRAPEAICLRCRGRGQIVTWHGVSSAPGFIEHETVDCPDCHGTGKRALVDNKKGE